MQVDQKFSRIIPCFIIVTLEGNPPQAIDTDQVLKSTYFNFAPPMIQMTFFPIDEPEVSMEALRNARRQLLVVDKRGVAQYLGEEVLLLVWREEIYFWDYLVSSRAWLTDVFC